MMRFIAAMLCFALCLPLTVMSTDSAQAHIQVQIQSRDMVENLSEFQVSPDPETSLWLSDAYSENPAELEYYLEQYHGGEYVEIANRKIDHLDTVFWQSIVRTSDLQHYLKSFPEGRYAVLASKKLAKTQSEKNVAVQVQNRVAA